MYRHGSRESWSDALFWGVTLALGVLILGAALFVYLNLWAP